MILLSEKQAEEILSAHKKGSGGEVAVSLDLGKSISKVIIKGDVVLFPDGQKLDLNSIRKIEGETCFAVEDCKLFRIQMFSKKTMRTYKLVPTQAAPALSISGVRMHQTKDYNPLEDAKMKAAAIKPLKDRIVLDTCMGLGYSAIQAVSEGALHVTTVEEDDCVVELTKVNPWSSKLWNSSRINMIEGDVACIVAGFQDECFDRIIHDPPRIGMAGELYGGEFYRQLFRVMKPGGILFHYVGRPGSNFRHKNIMKGVIERLRNVGFTGIRKIEASQGVKAVRGR